MLVVEGDGQERSERRAHRVCLTMDMIEIQSFSCYEQAFTQQAGNPTMPRQRLAFEPI
jgi:hypothetical protein